MVWELNEAHPEYLTDLLHLGSYPFNPDLFFPPCSYTSSSPAASCPATRGTGRRATKAVTASPSVRRCGANPSLNPEISLARTLSPPRFPVPVPFPLQLQPPAVPPWARRGLHHRVAASGATVDLPQVPIFLIYCHSGSALLAVPFLLFFKIG